MEKVFFSVVIPLYNKEIYIRQCIESVLQQSYTNFEIIVVDDGSSDNSVLIVEGIDDERIFLTKKNNGGVSSARNKGLELSKAGYIAFLDADDWYEKDFLSTMAGLIGTYPGCDAFTCAYNKHFSSSIQSSYIPITLSANAESFIVESFYSEWSRSAFFFTSSIVVRAEYFKTNKICFPVNENMGEDQEVWFHLAEHGKICYTKNKSSNYRIGSENSLTLNNNLNLELPFVTRLKRRVEKDGQMGIDINGRRNFIQRYELELAVNNAKAGHKRIAIGLLLKNASFKQLMLVLTSITFIILPVRFAALLRKAVRKLK